MRREVAIALMSASFFFWAATLTAQEAPAKFERYIKRFPDNRTLFERLLNTADLTLEDVGPAYALVAGIDHYPKLQGKKELKPAGVDVDKLLSYLSSQEHFAEIVVLRNEEVTQTNLDYFLHRYFPKRLSKAPRSRFLFAFSGHGAQEGTLGFLLRPDAESFDAEFGISLNVIRGYYDRILNHAFQSLMLINACHSGALLHRESFGRVIPKDRGHWAITSGGNASELVWHDSKIGPGSIFFEKFFAALDGRADYLPQQEDGRRGDGLVNVEELFSYLKTEIQAATSQSQTPRMGNISIHGDQGSFFFFDRKRRIQPTKETSFLPTESFGTARCQTVKECLEKGEDFYDEGRFHEAEKLLRKACLFDNPTGCLHLGEMYENGLGVAADRSRAAEMFHQACEGGDTKGCDRLKAYPMESTRRKAADSPFEEKLGALKIPIYGKIGDPQMILIEGGTFLTYTGTHDTFTNSLSHRSAKVSSFKISKTEITVGQYRDCVVAGICQEPSISEECNWGQLGRDDHPINCINRPEAEKFAKWFGARLPSELEWEYAARSGGLEKAYPWGNKIPTSCNLAHIKGCGNSTTSVCSTPRGNTAHGLCDMVGNVQEWVLDPWDWVVDFESPQSDLAAEALRSITRGGSFELDHSRSSVTTRIVSLGGQRYADVGFRIAKSSEASDSSSSTKKNRLRVQ